MDVLTDICATLRLRGELYFHAALCSPFAVRLPNDARLIRFHCVLQGTCFVTVPDKDPVLLEAGDVVLVPEGRTQVLSSSPNMSGPVALDDVLETYPVTDGVLSVGNGKADTRLLCGYLHIDQATTHPILSALPKVVLLKSGDPYCGPALQLLQSEARLNAQGTSLILHRIVEIILIQTLRNAVDMDLGASTFAAALRDPKLAKCLAAIHADPQHHWTIDRLANHVGVSRSVLSQRFNATVGMGPISYLTQWRMIKAKRLLTANALSMAAIAEQCGYTSVPAFTRRFSATFGTGPSHWRKVQQRMSGGSGD